MFGFIGGTARGPSPKPIRLEKLGVDEEDGCCGKGAVGPPVNCCTMARKFVVSVLSKVVGVRREARDRLLVGFETRPSGPNWVLDVGEPKFTISCGTATAAAISVVVVIVVESAGSEDVRV